MRLAGFIGLVAGFVLTGPVLAQPNGIEAPRGANTSLIIEDVPPTTAGAMELVPRFPSLWFERAIAMEQIPDGSGRFVLLEREGELHVIPDTPNPVPGDVGLYLDITSLVGLSWQFGELGALGMAFHPDFADNGELYVFYTTRVSDLPEWPFNTVTGIISRFVADDPSDSSISLASEQVVMTFDLLLDTHNGGWIGFGPDGMLYISVGDGGWSQSSWDPPSQAHPQDRTNVLGSILRIDVSTPPTAPDTYVIPPDNPFIGNAGERGEIWAYGFRNPFRCGFDHLADVLYCGDVGEATREEINVVVSGGNYGWPIFEGSTCFNNNGPDPCNPDGLVFPIAEHDTGPEAVAILGGYVYSGTAVPALYGMYIYTDFIRGTVWGLRYDGSSVTHDEILVTDIGTAYGLAQDLDGEVYILRTWQSPALLRPASPPQPNNFPLQLSDLPALLAAGLDQDQTLNGIYPYAPQGQLWSDGSVKSRYFALPGLDQINYTASGGWDFTEGSVLVKNFSLPLDMRDPGTAQRIETRLMVRNGGQWHGFSYEWNEAQTDAALLTGARQRTFSIIDEHGNPESYDWHYPSRNECFICHTAQAGVVLGLNTAQMNHDFAYPDSGVTDNQLRAFEHVDLFSAPLPEPLGDLPSSPDPYDTSRSLHDRVFSYLNANCAMCHLPGGNTPVSIDLRWGVDLESRGLMDVVPLGSDLGLSDARIVAPGHPDRSVLLERMRNLQQHRMPPLATSRLDQQAISLIYQWIFETGGDVFFMDRFEQH